MRYYHTWYQHQSSSYLFSLDIHMSSKYKIEIRGNLNCTEFIHVWLLKHANVSLSRVALFLTCRPYDPGILIFSDFNSDVSTHMKCLIVGWYWHWVLYLIFSGMVVFPCLQYVRIPFFLLSRKSKIHYIYVTCVSTVQFQSW